MFEDLSCCIVAMLFQAAAIPIDQNINSMHACMLLLVLLRKWINFFLLMSSLENSAITSLLQSITNRLFLIGFSNPSKKVESMSLRPKLRP